MMIWDGVPETEHPGVYVEEVGGNPKSIDGVPTSDGDLFESMSGARFRYGVAIGGAALAGLGILLALPRGNVIFQLFDTPAGPLAMVVLFVAALLLSFLRRYVEWRRRVAGRALLPVGKVAFGVVAFMLATLVAVTICLIALAALLLAGPDFTSIMVTATINVLVGCFLVQLAGTSLRDVLLLAEAIRDRRPDPASISAE